MIQNLRNHILIILKRRLQIENEQEQYKRKLELRRFHKWKKIEEKHVTTELILESGREDKGTTIKTIEVKQTTEAISDSENKLKDPPHSEINNIKGTENEILHNIKLNESNITDNRKERKKVRKVTYSDVVKGNACKDMGEKIVNLEEIRTSLLSDSSSQHYSTSPPVYVVTLPKILIH